MKRGWKIIIGLELAVIVCLIGWIMLGKGKATQEQIFTAIIDTTAVPAVLRDDETYGKADKGDVEATYMVGEAFRLGYLVPKSGTTAMAWFRKVADNGYALAQLRLGEAYLTGTEGVPLDCTVAITWLKRAAAGNDSEAQYLLGRMYHTGENGMPKDEVAAYNLLDKAVCQGHGAAERLRDELEEKYPQLNLVGYLESLKMAVAVPGSIQFKIYTFDSGQHKKSVPSYLTLRYSVAWPVAGSSPDAVEQMQRAIAMLFFEFINENIKGVNLTGAILRDPQACLERRAKLVARNVTASGCSVEQSETIAFSVIYQGDGIVSGVLNSESRLLCGENFDLIPVSFDFNTGRRIKLADIFKKGSAAALASVFRKALHRNQNIPLDERLDKHGFEKDETIVPPNAFGLTHDSILFAYDKYPKSANVKIPYADIVSLLRTDIPAAALWRGGRVHAMLTVVDRPPVVPPPVEDVFGIEAASRLKIAKITAAEEPVVIAAASKGDVNACLRLGRFYLDRGGVENERRAVKWLRKVAATAADPQCMAAFFMLREPLARIRARHPEVSDNEYVDAHDSIGVALGRKNKINEAINVAIEEAWSLHAPAQIMLRIWYAMPCEGIPDHDPRILKFFRESAAEGVAPSQDVLGQLYFKGNHVPVDHAKAVYWWKKAATGGISEAQYNLGVCYRDGMGIAKNEKKAVEWFGKAAEQGDDHAIFNLGLCYANGTGTPVDDEKALTLFRKAAEEKNERAEFMIGVFYEDGRAGLKKDVKAAMEWYIKSAQQEFEPARQRLRELKVKWDKIGMA